MLSQMESNTTNPNTMPSWTRIQKFMEKYAKDDVRLPAILLRAKADYEARKKHLILNRLMVQAVGRAA